MLCSFYQKLELRILFQIFVVHLIFLLTMVNVLVIHPEKYIHWMWIKYRYNTKCQEEEYYSSDEFYGKPDDHCGIGCQSEYIVYEIKNVL